MSATILKFPAARRSPEPHRQGAQPFGAAPQSLGAGAVSLDQVQIDEALERRIANAHTQVLMAPNRDQQLTWFEIMKNLCKLRSARQVERMERAKGLR